MPITHDISLEGLSVCIGMPCSRDINPFVVKSLFATQTICLKHRVPVSIAMVAGNSVIQWARDEVSDLLLKTDSNRFFLIDSDIVWAAEDFMRLLALSQKRDIVCGAYTAKREQPTFFVRWDESKPLVADEYGLIEVMGLGLGFTVMSRDVLEAVSCDSVPIYDEITQKAMPSIFKISAVDGKRRGEDMAFFDKIRDLGYKVYVDPSINLGHIGQRIYYGTLNSALKIEQ